MARLGVAPRDDRSSKIEPKRVESDDRDTSLTPVSRPGFDGLLPCDVADVVLLAVDHNRLRGVEARCLDNICLRDYCFLDANPVACAAVPTCAGGALPCHATTCDEEASSATGASRRPRVSTGAAVLAVAVASAAFAAAVRFASVAVQLLWLEDDGKEHLINTLDAANPAIELTTFHGHRFAARPSDGSDPRLFTMTPETTAYDLYGA